MSRKCTERESEFFKTDFPFRSCCWLHSVNTLTLANRVFCFHSISFYHLLPAHSIVRPNSSPFSHYHPNNLWHPLNHDHDSGSTQTHTHLQYSLLRKVESTCREKNSCKIMTSAESLSAIDPCPGVSKLTEVAFKCRPSKYSAAPFFFERCNCRIRVHAGLAFDARSQKVGT